MYKVEYMPSVAKQIEKLDKYTKRIIVDWIGKNLVNCDNPRVHGKPISANRTGQWRYRIGDYRIIAKIYDDKLLILVLTIGHRNVVYNG